MHVCMYVCMYVYMYVCMRIYIYICMCVYVYVYVCIYIYIHTARSHTHNPQNKQHKYNSHNHSTIITRKRDLQN